MKSMMTGAWVCVGASVVASGICRGQCGEQAWVQGPNLPSSRSGSAMAYDSVRERLVMFGGMVTGGLLSNTTLEFDGDQWQTVLNASPPSARTGHAMAFDESRGVVVLFGGAISTGISAATFEYDGVWRMVSPATSPPGLKWHAMAYDPVRQVTVLHGGMLANGATSSQTYEFNGVTWTPRGGGGPGMRYQHSMAFDASSATMLLFGGRTSTTGAFCADSWQWNGFSWNPLASSAPSARAGAAIVSAPSINRVLMFGGFSGIGYFDSTWLFDGTIWTQLELGNVTQPRSEAAIGFDAAHSKVVMAGGWNGATSLNDVWVLSVGAPSTIIPPSQAVPSGQTAAFTASATVSNTAWHWHHNGNLVQNDSRISGARTPTLTIASLVESDGGIYEAEATNPCGTTRSSPATLTVLPGCGTSDFNGDGDFGTDSDIEAFFQCLAGNCCGTCLATGADFNGDGDTGTDSDIEAFFRVLAGGQC